MRPLTALLFSSSVALGAPAMVPPLAAPLGAQASPQGKSAAKSGGKGESKGISGSYVGTATVPLGDSTIVVPVSYVFTGTAPAIGGTAMVPGQGTGSISNVVRDGAKIRFRVTAPENRLLEHDGVIAANGSIEGFVNLDNKPLAKFKVAPGTLPPAKPTTKSAPPAGAKPRG